MNFIDKSRIYAKGGDGGDGCLSFHREKYVEFGGPDGGNGGKGGDIYLQADKNLGTLLDFSHHPHLFAKGGSNGKGSDKYGRAGEDLTAKVPVGTVVYRDGKVVADLSTHGQTYLAAKGGRGGRGNAAFKSFRNTAPRIAEKGEPGEKVELDLELKLMADVGLVGLPNAGKSTMLSRVSNAKPKIADYPFTTLVPNLGMVKHRDRGFVMADIPGLIEGAHEGKGLGSGFLRHIERTRVLVHLIDPLGFQGLSVPASIAVIEEELKEFGNKLDQKPRLLAINKADLPEAQKIYDKLKKRRKKILLVSGVSGKGVRELLDAVQKLLDKPQKPEGALEEADFHVFEMAPGFSVERQGADVFKVSGQDVERLAAMTHFGQPEAVRRFQNILKKMGVDRELRVQGVVPGDTVRVGEMEMEWGDDPGPPKPTPPRRRKKRPAAGGGAA